MENLESITKSFTRFFVPGLAFLVFAITIPASTLGLNVFLGSDSLLSLTDAILLSILLGYVLDSIRAYRWTLKFRDYNHKKYQLTDMLATISGESRGTNPDHYIAVLWKQDESMYNRIFAERAEWVMILETSFSMLAGAIVLTILFMHALLTGGFISALMIILALLLLMASYLAAENGIDRMFAHDLKLIQAMRVLLSTKKKSAASRT